MGYKHIGFTFAFSTLYSVSVLSIFVYFLNPIPGLTDDLLLATVFGGIKFNCFFKKIAGVFEISGGYLVSGKA